MNKKELIEKYKYLNHNFFRRVDTSEVLRDLKQLDEPQKVTVPQFVAEWYEENKDDFETKLFRVIDLIPIVYKEGELSEFEEWIVDEDTAPFQTLVNMHQFGYTVEKPKRYFVKMKGVYHGDLGYADTFQGYSFYNKERNLSGIKYKLTRKEIEDAGFGEVFNSPLFEVEEVRL